MVETKNSSETPPAEAIDEIGLSDETIAEIIDELHEEQTEELTAHIHDLSIADTSDLLHKVNEEDRNALLQKYAQDFDRSSNVFRKSRITHHCRSHAFSFPNFMG